MPTVTATYGDLDKARQAMAALERTGVGSDAISLEGRPAARAAAEHDTSRRDRHVAAQVGGRVLLGGVIGAMIGAIVGALVGWLVFDSFGALLGSLLAGAVAGGAVGGAIGGYGTAAVSEDWELTHEDEPNGPVRLRVHSTDAEEVERAAGVLADRNPVSLDRSD
jgi:hypothetical protein